MAIDHQSVGEDGAKTDPVGLARYLAASDQFHRDTFLGRVLHPGTLSFRERVPEHSIHILITGSQVAMHVDRYAPLTLTQGGSRYSFWRAGAHNLAHLAEDFLRLLTGRRGEHRCVLRCQRVDTGDGRLDAMLVGSAATTCDTRVA
ncbi:MAG: hypothetical protein WD080_06745 [Egibacteraceae bacterium]